MSCCYFGVRDCLARDVLSTNDNVQKFRAILKTARVRRAGEKAMQKRGVCLSGLLEFDFYRL